MSPLHAPLSVQFYQEEALEKNGNQGKAIRSADHPRLSLIQVALLSDLQAALGEKQPTLPKLDVVYNNISIGAAPVWVTHEAGFFRKHELDVALTFARGVLATQAMVIGSFPIGFTSVSSVINANLAGSRLRFVGAVTNKLIYAVVTARDITIAKSTEREKGGYCALR